MIRMFDPTGSEIFPGADGAPAAGEVVAWYDLENPTHEEELRVEAALGLEVPSRDELRDIEPSSRLYTENGALYLTLGVAYKSDTDFPDVTDVGFVLSADKLVSVRYADPRAFRLFTASLCRIRDGNGPRDILTRLLETIIDRTAEILEQASRTADGISAKVFSTGDDSHPDRATRDLEATLVEIAQLQRLVAKARESLMSLARVASFLQAQAEFRTDKTLKERCRSISRDAQSLSEHANFISGNIIFLLDASLGLISVQQNTIIKIFSIAAVVLLPPTFIATIYGMNFHDMPELGWAYGYPIALGAMVVAAVVPYLWFRRKGWM